MKIKKVIALVCVFLLSITAFAVAVMATEDEASASASDIIMIDTTVENTKSSTMDMDKASSVTLAASLVALEFVADETNEISIPVPLSGAVANNVTEVTYSTMQILANDLRIGEVLKIEDVVYVPVSQFLSAIDAEFEAHWNQDEKTASYVVDDIEITFVVGESYIMANGRALPCEKIINVDGTIIAPLELISYCFGIAVEYGEDEVIIDTDSGINYLLSAEEYYVEEDLYWLSRIISAESGNQPMDGMIGVGNVVMNRTAHPSCPDTIYDVIFDSEHGVQFSVTENGTIYDDPREGATIAAKLCLEGVNVVGDSIYFVNPRIGSSSWFVSTRTFVASIGDHDFYS